MRLSSEAFALVKVASRNETRRIITGLRVEADGTVVATDGYRIAVLGPSAQPEDRLAHGVILPRGLVKTAADIIRAGDDIDLDLDGESPEDAILTIKPAFNGQTVILRERTIEGQYPNWQRLLSRVMEMPLLDVIPVNPELLVATGRILYGLAGDRGLRCSVVDQRPGAMLFFRGVTKDDRPFAFLLMGMLDAWNPEPCDEWLSAMKADSLAATKPV